MTECQSVPCVPTDRTVQVLVFRIASRRRLQLYGLGLGQGLQYLINDKAQQVRHQVGG